MSSTALALQMLGERRELTTRHGRTAFSILLFQDLSVIPILALIPLLAARSEEHTSELQSLMRISYAVFCLKKKKNKNKTKKKVYNHLQAITVSTCDRTR